MENKKNPVGRPKRSSVSSKTKGNRKSVGRPKGDAAIINEYKARMLNSPRSRAVMDAIFDAALDPEHKNQSAAWKLVMDRILPVAAYLQGQYNVNDLYIGVQSVIGRNGVEKIIEFDLTSKEKEMLNSSINSVKNLVSQIDL